MGAFNSFPLHAQAEQEQGSYFPVRNEALPNLSGLPPESLFSRPWLCEHLAPDRSHSKWHFYSKEWLFIWTFQYWANFQVKGQDCSQSVRYADLEVETELFQGRASSEKSVGGSPRKSRAHIRAHSPEAEKALSSVESQLSHWRNDSLFSDCTALQEAFVMKKSSLIWAGHIAGTWVDKERNGHILILFWKCSYQWFIFQRFHCGKILWSLHVCFQGEHEAL